MVDSNRETVVIEYFDSPVGIERHRAEVPIKTVQPVKLADQTRVYFYDRGKGVWQVGRANDHMDGTVHIALPNQGQTRMPESEAFVRWNQPLPDPWEHLAARITETPFFHESRSALVSHFLQQRAASAGMTALISSPVSLEAHQIEVVRRVLQDPVQRYLLADEVGLGKTVEAGIILRQHILDNMATHQALVIVPAGLVEQWREELLRRCQIGEAFGHRVEIIAMENLADWEGEQPDFIVVDEAHQAVRGWQEPASSPLRQRFERLRQLAYPDACPSLLLLSATPVRHNEESFLALLNLLDPVVHDLRNMKAFRQRVERRDELANLFATLTEDQSPYFLQSTVEELAALFPDDGHLQKLIARLRPLLADDALPEKTEFGSAIRTLRVHLGETYRLHRRLLRTRRGKHMKGVIVPGRGGMSCAPWQNSALCRVEGLLDVWRARAAASSEDLSACFLVLLEALWGDVQALLCCIRTRLERRAPADHGRYGLLTSRQNMGVLIQSPSFEGEEELLREILDLDASLIASQNERLIKLRAFAKAWLDQGFRVACLATSPALADAFFSNLHQAWGGGVARHRTAETEWRQSWDKGSAHVLVGDASAEEGLNLQGGRTVLLHLDVPLSPNRLEQRVGRLDRFGVGEPVRSATVIADDCAYWKGWLNCMTNAWRVFNRSIASLQYLVEDEMKLLENRLFSEGRMAMDDATERLGGDKGIVARELLAIRNQDELDGLENTSALFQADILESISSYEEREEEFGEAVNDWVVRRLGFEQAGEESPSDAVIRYQYRWASGVRPTLVSITDFKRWIKPVIDIDCEHPRFDPPLTFSMAFDRETARHRGVGLARIGHPVIDSFRDYLRWDDRGTCFAFWRVTSRLEPKVVRACFRYDFIVEADATMLMEWLQNELAASPEAIFRRADAAFPPIVETLWIDHELMVPSASLQHELDLLFSQEAGDRNLNQSRWPLALEQFSPCHWQSLCESTRNEAEKMLRERHGLKALAERCCADLIEKQAMDEQQCASHLEAFKGNSGEQAGFRAEMDQRRSMVETIISAIRTPSVRLDAAGVVFLSASALPA